jgi:hypothetical protein
MGENMSDKDSATVARAAAALCLAVLAAVGLAGCSSSEDPAGPDVVGMMLPTAEHTLKKAGVTADVQSDGLFGVLIEENWVVCKEHAVNAHMVRLEVSKNDC